MPIPTDNEPYLPNKTSGMLRNNRFYPRFDGIPDDAFIVADKYCISNRALTELAAVFMKNVGLIDKVNLSVKTTERRRKALRLANAQKITHTVSV